MLFTKKNSNSKAKIERHWYKIQGNAIWIAKSRVPILIVLESIFGVGNGWKKNARPARFPCGALNSAKIYRRIERSQPRFSLIPFFFFFASFLPFLFPFFAKKKRQPVCPRGLIVARLRKGDQFVSRRNILGKWSGRPCKSFLVNFILRLLDPYAESAPRFTATKSLTASTDPYPGFTSSSFSIKQARENIYNYRLSVSLLILYDWSRLFRNNFKQF